MGVLSQDGALLRPMRGEWWQREGRGESQAGEWAIWGGGKGQTNGQQSRETAARGQAGGGGTQDGETELVSALSRPLQGQQTWAWALGTEAHAAFLLLKARASKQAGSVA